MTEGQAEGSPEPGAGRRRVLAEPAKEQAEARKGCMVAGAALGIIVGLLFAFYGLPPILESIYGDEVVERGETFRGPGQEIVVEGWGFVSVDPAAVQVSLRVHALRAWSMEASDWTLVLEDDEVVAALAPDETRPETGLEFAPMETRDLVLLFPLLPGQDAPPDYVRLDDGGVRFELEERSE